MEVGRIRRRQALAFLSMPLLPLASVGASGRAARAAGPLLVLAAASLKNALDEIAARFTTERGVSVKLVYAASSALARQIEQGVSADLVLFADQEWMDWLAARRLVDAASRVQLLTNRLVLIAPKDRPISEVRIEPGFPLTQLLGDGRLAVAEVTAVPAGRYAKAGLQSLGVWPAVERRLAQAENVRAALALVARGETPLGIVYTSDALAEPAVKVLATFPDSSHPPIVYPMALTTTAAQKPEARALHAFIGGAAARAMFKAHGFGVSAEPAT